MASAANLGHVPFDVVVEAAPSRRRRIVDACVCMAMNGDYRGAERDLAVLLHVACR